MYDLIIAGAGPAGITAAVYAARKKMKLLVVTDDVGGQAAWSGDVENYTGYQLISGPELAAKFEEHMHTYGIPLRTGEPVTGLEKKRESVLVATARSVYEARTCIIATGKRTRELNVAGEKEFKNRGLTYCATCDGPLFSGKDVAVIGGGNSGLDAVLQLMHIARHVYLINISGDLTGDAVMQDKARSAPNVSVLNNTRVTAVRGDRFVTEIGIQTRDGSERSLAVRGVFVEIGLIPNSEFAGEVSRNERGEIKVSAANETNLAGIFAAGDVTDVPEKQIIIAAGEGSKACLSAFHYIARNTFS